MSTAEPMIAWRRRTDLVARSQAQGWVLKDPITQRYYQLGHEEYFVWSRLDGRQTLVTLCREFAERFAPRLLSVDELQKFLSQLMQQGLIWGDSLGTASYSAQRRSALLRSSAWGNWTNPLAIRSRGVNPDRWLTALLPWCRWCFSPLMLLVQALIIVSALGLWLTQFDEVRHRLPEEAAFWSVADLGSMALVLAGLKIAHELGHALVCKKLGGEVRELGVLFLVFTPCLYCNVSDAWLLPSRWQRMAISAAGMWVESVLAAIAFWLWWCSEPGWFHSACLQLVLISVVSTLAFNLNPLLRYDGYFLLSDLWGQPNLQQTAARHLSQALRELVWPNSEPAPFRIRFSLVLYAVTAMLYRIVMVCTIMWFLYHWLEPQGLRTVAIALLMVTLVTLFQMPVLWIKALWNSRKSTTTSWSWPSWRVIPLGLLLAALLFWPWPQRVHTAAVLLPADAEALYITQEGRLLELLAPGTAVQAGDVVARLENLTMQRELARLRGSIAATQQHVDGLLRRRVTDPRAQLQLPAAQRQLQDWQQQLAAREREADELVIRAPDSGIYWPAPDRPATSASGQLPHWSHALNDVENQNAYLTSGTHLGWIGAADRWEAIAYVPQSQFRHLAAGQPAHVAVDAAPDWPSTGEVTELSLARLATIAPDFSARLRLPLVQTDQGPRLVGSWYQVRIALAGEQVLPVSLASSQVAIRVSPASLVQRVSNWLRETFALVR
ncbi:HlyD family efflux transporter periplasmic adaptor subunit [bacterium]|nr:HlyD family efflux transporter periplasmic adaptor subunit [bacterium]